MTVNTATTAMIPLPAPRRMVRQPIDDRRKEIYLETLRATASHSAAACAATSKLNFDQRSCNNNYGYESFLALRRRDPAFEAACQDAISEAVGTLEAAAFSRALTPEVKKQLDRAGSVVAGAEIISWRDANNLLTRLLARLRPLEWAQRTNVDSKVSVTAGPSHRSQNDFVLDLGKIDRLCESDQSEVWRLLEVLSKDEGQVVEGSEVVPAQLPSPTGSGLP